MGSSVTLDASISDKRLKERTNWNNSDRQNLNVNASKTKLCNYSESRWNAISASSLFGRLLSRPDFLTVSPPRKSRCSLSAQTRNRGSGNVFAPKPFANRPKAFGCLKEPSMNIAVLGWGSLIWCPGSLRIKTRWRPDGPMLPIEFARMSEDGRLTLVINSGSADQPTYWALSEFMKVNEARNNLRAREHSRLRDIHDVDQNGSATDGAPREIVNKVTEWLARHQDVQAVVWTGLPSNWMAKRQRDFTPEDAVAFLSKLEAERDRAKATYERAREYVTNAPPLLDTAVRRVMRTRGWEDAPLPMILFETPPPPTNGD